MDNSLAWQMVLQIVLIASNAIFACAEIAVISINDNKVAHLVSQGDKRAIRLARLTNQPAQFLATIQVAITLSGFMASAFAADHFSDKLVSLFVKLGSNISVNTLDAISVVIITLILSYFTLVFGELVPKRLAMKKAEQLALAMAYMISIVAKITSPVVWLLAVSTNSVLRLFGIDPNAEDEKLSEEEIRMMVDIGNQRGVIDSAEKEIIQNVFEFDDLTVGEFATHRTNISWLWLDETPDEWEKTIHETRHSLYPICKETVDNVVGILKAKDYFRLDNKSKEYIIAHAVKPAFFVPESVYADVLFKQMKKSKNHFAVVLDEYGGVLGIVTMNDLLEQLVGDLENDIECKTEEADIEKLNSVTWKIRGCATLDDVSKELDIPFIAGEYTTFGGFVFGNYGFIPEDGSQFDIEIYPLHIHVIEIKDHRLEKAIVKINTSEKL